MTICNTIKITWDYSYHNHQTISVVIIRLIRYLILKTSNDILYEPNWDKTLLSNWILYIPKEYRLCPHSLYTMKYIIYTLNIVHTWGVQIESTPCVHSEAYNIHTEYCTYPRSTGWVHTLCTQWGILYTHWKLYVP